MQYPRYYTECTLFLFVDTPSLLQKLKNAVFEQKMDNAKKRKPTFPEDQPAARCQPALSDAHPPWEEKTIAEYERMAAAHDARISVMQKRILFKLQEDTVQQDQTQV